MEDISLFQCFIQVEQDEFIEEYNILEVVVVYKNIDKRDQVSQAVVCIIDIQILH